MNRIYKVIYSKVRQCYVVVSEIAKSHGRHTKSSVAKSSAALTAGVLIALGSFSFEGMPVVQAADGTESLRNNDFVGANDQYWYYDEKKGEWTTYQYKLTSAFNNRARGKLPNYQGGGAKLPGAITAGLYAQAGQQTVTIGDRNAGQSKGSVFIGEHSGYNNGDNAPAGMKNNYVTSVGFQSDATGWGSIAIGSNATAENSKMESQVVKEVGKANTSGTVSDDTYGIEENPTIQGASVALGYNAHSKDGNIAIGSYSDATSTDKNDSYVSVGNANLKRRITNVADGASVSDVATVGQLQALSKDLGGYKAGFGIQIDPDSTDKTKNTISLNRNLGTNLDKTGHVYLDVSKTGLVLGTVVDGAPGTDMDLHYGATGDYAVTVGGGANTASGKASVVLGGSLNKASNEATVASGGSSNVASGSMAAVYGGYDNEASKAYATIFGGAQNKASNTWTAVGGGALNEASGKYASVWGGYRNKATDDFAAVYGGLGNSAYGSYSAILGGGSNKAGVGAVVSGGASNEAAGIESAVLGGVGNIVTGANATAVGGMKGSVNGVGSVGILGGSTGINAPFTLAAGYQSTVTDTGVTSTPITEEEAEKFQEEGTHPGLLVGSGDPDNPTFKILDHFATAVGYQATADEAQTVAFGHDKGDTYYGTTTYTWKQKATVKNGHYYDEYGSEIDEDYYKSLMNADGTWNDYSQPIATVEEKKYDSAYYNRLVKAADGIEDHDAVVMEQLKNASDVGSHIKVYKTDTNGNVQFDEDNKPIEDTSDAAKRAQKASEDAWGEAIGTGKVEANNSQLVTGDTVYNAIQNQAEWKLTTNGESADKAAAIKPGTTVNFSAEENGKDHSNVTISHNGSNVTIGLDKDIVLGDTSPSSGGSLNVYADSSDGNNLSNHVSINGSTISVNYPKSNDDKKTTTDTRGVILGVGEEDSKPDGYIAFNNIEGGYTYLHASTDASDDKKGRLEYVGSDGNKKYIANLDDVSTAVNNAKTKYYAVDENAPLMNLDTYKNEGNDGAKGMGSLAAGFVTHADGIASTVAGSYSGVIGSGLQGAAAVSVGTVNVNNNTDPNKIFSGVANSIVGQANMTTDSNAAIIYGAGNTVTNSYRFIDPKKVGAIKDNVSDPAKLSKAMQDAVKESGGQVMVMGGGNNVESVYMSQVVGVGNTVKGNQVENDTNEWVTDTSSETAITDYAPEKSSQYNYVDGFNNEVINGKHDYVIGANNKLSGDSYDDDQANPIKRSNKSNIVIGDNHTLTRKQNTVIIGSSDTKNTQTIARDAVIIGHNANATSNTGADNAVAIGRSATATGGNAVTIGVNTSAGDNSITIGSESSAISGSNIAIGRYAKVDGTKVTNAVALGQGANAKVADGVAIGSGSEATVAGKTTEGYNPATGQNSTETTATWQATKAAVSIGKADGTVTRQINGVAAGTNDTDAVNVAQIKKLASINASNIGANLQYGADGTTAATDTDKTKNKEAWATAIGTGTVTKDDDGSKQMVTGKTVYDALHGGLDNITVGKDGQNGKDGSIGIAGQNGKDGYTMTIIKTEQGAAGVDGKDGITRVVYQDKDGNGKHTFATLDDGLKFKGDDSTVIAKKLNEQLNITGGADSMKLTDKNIGVNSSTDGLKIQLAKNLAGITSIANQTTTGKGDAQTTTGAKIDLKDDGSISVNSGKITDVKSGLTATDGTYADTDRNNAANIGDVHSMIEKEAGNTDDKLALKANVAADNIGTHITDTTAQKTNLDNWGAAIGTGAVADSTNEHANQLVTGKTVYDALHGGLDNITVGKDGQNGKDGSIGIAGQNGKDGYTMTIIKTEQGAAGVDGKDGITRVVYQDKDGNGKHTFATLDDGLKFKGDDSTVIAKKLDEQLNIIGGADSTKLTGSNIGVNSTTDGSLKIQLAKDLTDITSISNQTTTGDKTTGAKITLGTDGATTISGGDVSVSNNKITNIKAGEVKANSKDAVNGDQLYNEQQARTDADTAINNKIGTFDNSKTYNYIDKTASISTNLTTLDTHVRKNADDISQINTRIDTLDGNAVKYDDSTKSKITLAGSNGTTIDHVKDGTISSTSKEAVNGSQLNTEQQDRIASDTAINNKIGSLDKDGNYIKHDANISENLSTLDGQVKTNANAISKETTDREAADTAINNKIGSLEKDGNYIKHDASISQNLNLLDTQVKDNSDKIAQNTKDISEIKTNVRDLTDNAVQYDNDSKKSKITLAGEKGTTITNVKDGSVGKDSKEAVNGGQLFDEKTARENADTEIKTDITKIKDGEGFTDKGKTVIKSLAQNAVDVKGSDYVTVTNETKDGTKTFTVSVDGNGKVASGDKGLISGNTIYNELRPSADGSYIKKDSTTAQNLVSLDTQVKKTSDLINSDGKTIKIGGSDAATKIDVNGKDGKGRVITGVVSDANDPNSAANVGYVNGITAASNEQIYRDMNMQYNHVENDISRAAAGSNALAALHPMQEFDPDDKAQFALGYGHYRNSNAGAVGAFYQPDENSLFSFGVSFGNGDAGLNAGVTFKFGPGGSDHHALTKTQMAKVIDAQSKEIDELKKDNANKDKRIDALEQKMTEILAKLDSSKS